jgi:PPP family 3-phenylpropionic acid transporter
MKDDVGKKFIPSFIFSNFFLAITAPYLIILLRDIGYSPFHIGILLGLCETAGIIAPFALGYGADKTGNYRPVLILSCIVPVLVAYPLVIWVHPVASAVFLFLIAFGIRSLISLIDAITTVQIGTSGNYGKFRMWGSIAFVALTLFFQWTPFLRPDDAPTISLWIAVISALCVIPILALPSYLLKVSPEAPVKDQNPEEKTIPAAFAYIFCGFAVIFLSRFGMTAVITYLPLYMIEVIEWDAFALMFAIAAIAEVPLLLFAKKLICRFNSMSMLVLSAVSVSIRLLILAFLPFKPWIVVSSLLHSICFGVYHPAAIHFITTVFPVEQRGRGMSMYMIMGTGLPSIAGIMLGGAIIEGLGYGPLFILYAAISGLSVICYGLLRLRRS